MLPISPVASRALPVLPACAAFAQSLRAAAQKPSRWVIAIAVLGFTIGIGAIVPLLRAAQRSSSEAVDVALRGGDTQLILVNVFVTVLVLGRLAGPRRRSLSLQGMFLPLAFALVAAASIFWSVEPSRTLRRVGALGAGYAFGFFLFQLLDFAQLRRIALFTLGALTVASAATALLLPGLGQTMELGHPVWRGVFETKNNLGSMILLGNCFCLSAFLDGVHKKLAAALLLLSMVCLYFSDCKTAMLATAILAAVAVVIRGTSALRWGIGNVTLAVVVGVSILAILIASASSFGLIDGDQLGGLASLTGRVPLWRKLMDAVAEKPLFGYGLESFWRSQTDMVLEAQGAAGWKAYGSHNGYVEMLLSLGAVGLTLFVLTVLSTLVRAWKGVVAGKQGGDSFVFFFSLSLLFQNVAEPFAFRTWSVYTALTVYTYLLMHMDSLEAAFAPLANSQAFGRSGLCRPSCPWMAGLIPPGRLPAALRRPQ